MKVFKSKKGEALLLASYNQLLTKWQLMVTEEDIDTRYGKTHIIKAGNRENKALLLFHGVGDNSSLMWIYNAKELAKHFYIIAVDTIGGPNKSMPNENYNKSFSQLMWVNDVIEGLHLDRPHMAGVSNGAAIVQNYGANYPDKVDKIVAMAGLLLSDNTSMKKMLKVFLPEALFPTKKNMIKLINKLTGENKQVFLQDEEIMTHWLYLLKYFNNMAMGYHKPKALEKDEREILKNKLLLIIGTLDPIAYDQEVVVRLLQEGFQIKVVEKAGHGINHEKSSLINKMMIDYLRDDKIT